MNDWMWWLAILLACFGWAYVKTNQGMEKIMCNEMMATRVRMALVEDGRIDGKHDDTRHLCAFAPFSAADDSDLKLLAIYDIWIKAKYGKPTKLFWNFIATDSGAVMLEPIVSVESMPRLHLVHATWIHESGKESMQLNMNQVL